MKVAVVSPHPISPATSGDRIRTVQLLEALQARGVDVTLVTFTWTEGPAPDQPWPVISVPGRPSPVRSIPWRLGVALARRNDPFALYRRAPAIARLRAALDQFRPDVVDFQHSFSWIPVAHRSVLTMHNVEVDRLGGQGATTGSSLAAVARMERAAITGADAVVVLSDDDGQRVRQLDTAARPHVVPLGYSPSGGPHPSQSEVMKTAAYVGSFDYPPNVEAARHLAGMWPELQRRTGLQRLLLIGRRPAALARVVRSGGGVEVVGEVEDVPQSLRAVDVLLVPLLSGGGVRVKIIEAFALRIPVVGTPLAVEGLGVVSGQHAVVAPPAGFAEAVASICGRPARERLASSAYELWRDSFSPSVMAERMVSIYEQVR